MMDFDVTEVLGLLRRTAPFLGFRLLVYLGITLAYVIATGGGAGIGYALGHIGGDPGAGGAWGGIAGFALVGALVYWFREYLLYLVKAGHIAVLVELLDGADLPGGRGQIEHARSVVQERFAEASVLFGVDQLVRGVIRAFNRVFFSVATLLPLPGVEGLARVVNGILRLSLTYVDEVILAYGVRTRSDNPWASSRTALVLYGQNYRAFLRNAVILALCVWGLTLAVFLVVLAPVAALVAVFPGAAGGLTLLVALVFAWAIKAAVIEPFAMTALMQAFFRVTEGQTPDPAWETRLEELSERFTELGERARSWASGHTVDTPGPATADTSGGESQPRH
ncbi:hypothetical protein ACEZHJ_10940 [Arhodomonas sp. KWT2]|uniref:hypothetical protein n=1 Tax=Arhodomonas sp. KWT2 TaxID=3344194 RepID=UPI0035C256F9